MRMCERGPDLKLEMDQCYEESRAHLATARRVVHFCIPHYELMLSALRIKEGQGDGRVPALKKRERP